MRLARHDERSKGAVVLVLRTSNDVLQVFMCGDGTTYMPAENMMCALGVPGNISQGDLSDGLLVRPVDAVVA